VRPPPALCPQPELQLALRKGAPAAADAASGTCAELLGPDGRLLPPGLLLVLRLLERTGHLSRTPIRGGSYACSPAPAGNGLGAGARASAAAVAKGGS
jgi:hypothetical protein